MSNMVKEIRDHIENNSKKNQNLVIKDLEQSIGHVLTMLELESAFEENNKLWLAKNIEQITTSGKNFYMEAMADVSFIKTYLSFPSFIRENNYPRYLKEITELLVMDSALFAKTIKRKLLAKESAYFEALIYPLHQNQTTANQAKKELLAQLVISPETAYSLEQELQTKITCNKNFAQEVKALFQNQELFAARLFSDVIVDLKKIFSQIEITLAQEVKASLQLLGITPSISILNSNARQIALGNIHQALSVQKSRALQESILNELPLFVKNLTREYTTALIKTSEHNISQTVALINNTYLKTLKSLYQNEIYNLYFALFGKFFGDIEGSLEFVSDKKTQKKVAQYKRLYNNKKTKKHLAYLKKTIINATLASGLSQQDLDNFIESFLYEEFRTNLFVSERKKREIANFLAYCDPVDKNNSTKNLLKKIASGLKNTSNKEQQTALEAEETLFCWASICEFSTEEYIKYILSEINL